MLGDVNKLFGFKSLLTTPSNVLPLHLKQTFPHIIWILTEGKGDGIESRLPFKIFSTLNFSLYLKIKSYFKGYRVLHPCTVVVVACLMLALFSKSSLTSTLNHCGLLLPPISSLYAFASSHPGWSKKHFIHMFRESSHNAIFFSI